MASWSAESSQPGGIAVEGRGAYSPLDQVAAPRRGKIEVPARRIASEPHSWTDHRSRFTGVNSHHELGQ